MNHDGIIQIMIISTTYFKWCANVFGSSTFDTIMLKVVREKNLVKPINKKALHDESAWQN